MRELTEGQLQGLMELENGISLNPNSHRKCLQQVESFQQEVNDWKTQIQLIVIVMHNRFSVYNYCIFTITVHRAVLKTNLGQENWLNTHKTNWAVAQSCNLCNLCKMRKSVFGVEKKETEPFLHHGRSWFDLEVKCLSA